MNVQQVADTVAIPTGFAALADAVIFGRDIEGACHEIGRLAAEEGQELGEVLATLEITMRRLGADVPTFVATKAVALAWSEVALRFQHTMSCEDPMTGLASLAHLRSLIDSVYSECERAGESVTAQYALLVVETFDRHTEQDRLHRTLRQVELANILRRVYSGGECIACASSNKMCVLVRRDEAIGTRAVALTAELDTWGGIHLDALGRRPTPRVWIEGLPSSVDGALVVLDELAR